MCRNSGATLARTNRARLCVDNAAIGSGGPTKKTLQNLTGRGDLLASCRRAIICGGLDEYRLDLVHHREEDRSRLRMFGLVGPLFGFDDRCALLQIYEHAFDLLQCASKVLSDVGGEHMWVG
jgi:hypothetical protein